MKNIKRSLILVIVMLLVITGCGKSDSLNKEKGTTVSLKNVKITADQFYKELKKDSIKKLVDMIDHKLFDKKYPTTSEETESINNQIESIKSYYKDDEASYLSAIKSYFGVSSEKELRNALSIEYKRNLAVKDYLKKKVTKSEINKYYEENVYGDIKASHILISVDNSKDLSDEEKEKQKEKALTKAKNIIKKLDKGEDFGKLAEKYSDDKATATKKGNLGYFNSKEMDGSFWNAAYELEKGKYSKEPVESAYGYHIILKTGEKKKKSLKSMKDEIKTSIVSDKLSSDSTLYYKTLVNIREDKKIKFNDSDLQKQYKKYNDKLISNTTTSSN